MFPNNSSAWLEQWVSINKPWKISGGEVGAGLERGLCAVLKGLFLAGRQGRSKVLSRGGSAGPDSGL